MGVSILTTIMLHLLILVSLASFAFSLPDGLENQDIFSEITTDPAVRSSFATDFGNMSKALPGAVFYPSSPIDIAELIRFSYCSAKPFPIAPRGAGHSSYGQTFVPDGVLVYMPSLGRNRTDHSRINVIDGPIPYADVGGEQLWIDILNATLKYGLRPRMFTDYLHLSVGGTLSNAGVSGGALRHGPQISNVYDLDVITGTGEIVTCSAEEEPDLFYAALGGLGQFGVITRARIALEPALKMARWVRLFYTDVKQFTSDQEKLISENSMSGFNFVAGEFILSVPQVSGILGYNFSATDVQRITQLAAETDGPVYLIDAVIYYNDTTATSLDQDIKLLLEGLHYISGFKFTYDLPLIDFLERVYYSEVQLTQLGIWFVPHPGLDVFVPKSKALEFDSRILKGLLKGNNATGSLWFYPMNRTKWDDRMSAVTPDEEVFYLVSLLWTALANDTEILKDLNNQVIKICDEYNLGCKEYLPHFTKREDWKRQFGNKWGKFVSRKKKYDPKAIMSPGKIDGL